MLPIEIRKTVVNSLIMPLFDYCSPLFTNVSQTLSLKMQRAQNACVRFITGKSKFDHVTPIYKELGLLKLTDRRIVSQSILLWKIIKFKKPMYLYENFVKSSEVNIRQNRNTGSTMLTPLHRTETYAKSFTVTSTKLWNSHKLSIYQSYQTPTTLKHNLTLALCNLY